MSHFHLHRFGDSLFLESRHAPFASKQIRKSTFEVKRVSEASYHSTFGFLNVHDYTKTCSRAGSVLMCACVCVRLRVHVCVSACAYVYVCACVSVCVISPLSLPTLAATIMACTTSSKLASRNGENRTRICVVRRFMFCKRVADSVQQESCRRVADSVQRGTSPQLSFRKVPVKFPCTSEGRPGSKDV